MRICLDVSAALAQTAGIGRYARELALALHRTGEVELSLFHNRPSAAQMPAALAALPRSQAPLSNKAWRFYLLAGLPLLPDWRAAIDGREIFHGADAVTPRLSIPTVITIHDLTTHLIPQHHTRLNRLYLRWALPIMVRRANAIIADSYATQRDIMAQLGVPPGKITVVHLGVDGAVFAPQSSTVVDNTLAQLGVRPPYLLAVGTLEPRKNLATLLRAYATLPASAPALVLVGGQGWGDNPLSAAIEELGLRGRVHMTGFVADARLPALYSGAEVFIYPSLYEGFGLPVLEAMACGAPVITSNVSSLPEVAGEAALLVAPLAVAQLADALQTLLDSPTQRTMLRQAGLHRATAFTWDASARNTVALYRSVLGQPG